MTVANAPQRFDDPEEHRRQIANAIRRVNNNFRTGRVTFANGATSTVLTVRDLSAATGHVSLTPTNATAQGFAYSATYNDGSITFTHADPGADATFSYLAMLAGG